jgi:O-acetyl-ADP-ribose deacetylase (regulator of RNase III)
MSKNTKIIPTFTEVKGDAIELFFKSATDAVIMHGANCQKIMGAGFAKQVKSKLAPLFYLDQYDTRDATQRFGSYSAVVVGEVDQKIKVGVNLYTQFNPGAEFDITALRNSLKAFRYSIPLEKRVGFTLYLPMIGCGIGGGNWIDVLPVIKKELAHFNVVVVDYVAPKPEKSKK